LEVLIWDTSTVPTAQADLHDWLAEITNARSFPDSDAIAWP
jgi:hypothetical protein